MTGLVLDASVTLAALLPDDAEANKARVVMDRAAVEHALVPSLWIVEVGNGLVTRCRRGRLEVNRIDGLLAELRAVPVVIDPQPPDRAWNDCIPLSLRHRLTLYDTLYLELALRHQLPLATFDKALRRAAEAERIALANPPA